MGKLSAALNTDALQLLQQCFKTPNRAKRSNPCHGDGGDAVAATPRQIVKTQQTLHSLLYRRRTTAVCCTAVCYNDRLFFFSWAREAFRPSSSSPSTSRWSLGDLLWRAFYLIIG